MRWVSLKSSAQTVAQIVSTNRKKNTVPRKNIVQHHSPNSFSITARFSGSRQRSMKSRMLSMTGFSGSGSGSGSSSSSSSRNLLIASRARRNFDFGAAFSASVRGEASTPFSALDSA